MLTKWLTGALATFVLIASMACATAEARALPEVTSNGQTVDAAISSTPVTTNQTRALPSRASVPEATVGEAVEFPEDTTFIIETGCWACDGPTSALYAVGRAGNGPVKVEAIFDLDDPAPGRYITSFALSQDASEIIVGVCTRGYCGGLGQRSNDAVATFYRSNDFGRSWRTMAAPEGVMNVVAVTPEHTVFTVGYQSFNYEDGTPVKKPAPDAEISWCGTRACGLVWWLPSTRQLQMPDGTLLDVAGDRTHPEVALTAGKPPLLFWPPLNPTGDFLLATPDEGIVRSPEYFMPGGWQDGGVVATYPVVATHEVEGRPVAYAWPTPSLIDLYTGVIHPIAGVFDQPPFGGRNRVVAVLPTSSFIRSPDRATAEEAPVPETCVGLRDRPLRNHPVATCELPSRLRTTGEQRYSYGQWYYGVFTPDGRHGWVEAQLLPASTR